MVYNHPFSVIHLIDILRVFLFSLIIFVYTVKAQLDPEIVDEIIPEITSQGGEAKLNCTVVNKQPGHTVLGPYS